MDNKKHSTNYFKILKSYGYKNISQIRTFDNKILYVTYHGVKKEDRINLEEL